MTKSKKSSASNVVNIIIGLGLWAIVFAVYHRVSDDQTRPISSYLTSHQLEVLTQWSQWSLMANTEQFGTRKFEERENTIVSRYRQLPNRLSYDQGKTNHIAFSQDVAMSVLSEGEFQASQYAEFEVASWRCINKVRETEAGLYSGESFNNFYSRYSCWMPFDRRSIREDFEGLLEKDVTMTFGNFGPFIELILFSHPVITDFENTSTIYTNDILELDGLAFCSGIESSDRIMIGTNVRCSFVASSIRNLEAFSEQLPAPIEGSDERVG